MQIRFHKTFKKHFDKLSLPVKNKAFAAIKKFSKNPHDASLKNHPLLGKLEGARAFSVTGDVRIIFKEYEKYILVIMLDIGTHNQVY